uniref:selenocysteine lyase isoform X2 n=1 Tax=Jaculus jaculus TaxID=51337 RepID=UPI001E1B07EC|nr:selenocysteine lyase isoform X2 [Jaculus jaculus]
MDGMDTAPRRGLRSHVGSQPGGRETSPPERKVYMDYNATTPLEPAVMEAVTEAMREAWGNPSSSYVAGKKAKDIINTAREAVAKMVGGRPQDIIFTSGGTESNNLVIHSVLKNFHKNQTTRGNPAAQHIPEEEAKAHFVTCTVEHDSIRLPLEHLVEEQVADVTFVPVSKASGRAEVDDILAAVRPTTCLVTIMLANNETGVIMFYGPRIGALYVRGLGKLTHLRPMLFGGGQERSFRPGTENTPMIAGLGKAAELVTENCEVYEAHMRDVRDYLEERLEAEFGDRIHLNSRFPGVERLPNTCNFSIRGSKLQGYVVLAQCRTLLASVGASCHSDQNDRPSPVLLSCGIPVDVARNALRLSVGRSTTKAEVDLVIEDLKQSVAQLEGQA